MTEERNIKDALWERLNNYPGSYEFKEEIVWRASKAIETRDMSKLDGMMVLFHPGMPNDLEEYTAESARMYMEEHGIVKFVLEKIQEDALDYIIADRYDDQRIEILIKVRAKKAIAMSNMMPLRMGINVVLPDGGKYSITSEEMEEKAKEIGLWEYVTKEIAKKLPKTEEEDE